jgi:mannose-1-phosphate guanylyltransferase
MKPGSVRTLSPNTKEIRVVLLCAGEGRRMHPLTLACPKPMLTIGGRPAIDYLLELCRFHGLGEVAINLHHCPEVIPAHLGDGSAFGMALCYSPEESLLGSAGALGPLADFLDRPFFVLYGDVLTNMDLTAMADFHRRHGGQGTVALYRVPDPERCGLVDTESTGRIHRFVEKPAPGEVFTNLVNAGVYLLEPTVLAHLPATVPYDFGRDFFPHLLAAGVPLYGYPLRDDEYLLDFGTPENHARAQAEWPAVWSRGPIRR